MSRPCRWGVLPVMLICGVTATIAWSQSGDAAQEKAIAEIAKSGGKAERDEAIPEKPVVAVDFGATQVADAGLESLRAFPKLRKLTLNGTKVTDEGLEHLKGLADFQRLYLVDTKITDAGLERLKGLTSLRVLSLVGTQVTDAGLEHLKGLEGLQEVFLLGTKVTDDGVKKFKEALPKVKIDR
jgi:Leucine Rich repeat